MEDVDAFGFVIRPVKLGEAVLDYRWYALNTGLRKEVVLAMVRQWLVRAEEEYKAEFAKQGTG